MPARLQRPRRTEKEAAVGQTRRTPISLTQRGAMHPLVASAVALSASLLAALIVYLAAGPHNVTRVFSHLQPQWLVLAATCELVSLPSYAVAYQAVVDRHGHHHLGARLAVEMVIAGFGAFAVVGGFSLDRRALRLLGAERRAAALSVLALGLSELFFLGLAAFVTAVVLLLKGTTVTGSMLWPWAIGAPLVLAGACLHVWWTRAERHRRPTIVDDGIETITTMLGSWSSVRAFCGLALYFTAEIAALGLALRAFGISIGAGALVIAYASGYLFTRRTLPLGGAGVVEVLLTLSLYWVGPSFAAAFATVVVYRAMNFLFVAGLALLVRTALGPTLRAAAELEDRLRAIGSDA